MRYIKTRPKSQSAFKVALRRSPLPFCSSFETKKKLVLLVKKRALGGQSASSKVFYVRTGKGSVCVYMCRVRDNFDCLYFFVVSFYYPFFFVWGKKRFDVGKYLFIYFVGQKNIIVVVVVVQKVAAFKERKIGFTIFFTRFIKPLPPVLLVFKKDDDDDFDDDNNALSSSV